jgi:hypothetical protein
MTTEMLQTILIRNIFSINDIYCTVFIEGSFMEDRGIEITSQQKGNLVKRSCKRIENSQMSWTYKTRKKKNKHRKRNRYGKGVRVEDLISIVSESTHNNYFVVFLIY